MLEKLISRVKFTLLTMLFIAPLAAAQWNMQLDAWLQQNHRWEPLAPHYVPDDQSDSAQMDSPAPDFAEIDAQIPEEAG